MALYDEAMSVKEVGKPEYSARCESIASEIFPVEQQVLSSVNTSSRKEYADLIDSNPPFYAQNKHD